MLSWLADNFTPMWIVWLIAIVLVVVVFGAILRRHERGDSFRDTVGTSPFTLLMILIYASSVLLAPLATAFSSPTRVDWWQMAAVRVAWQLGGGILLGAALLWEARYGGTLGDWRVWLTFGALILVGGLMCLSSFRDLVDGPVVLRGKPTFESRKRTAGVAAASSRH